MAQEGRQLVQPTHFYVSASSLTDETTSVHGDQVGTKPEVAAGRIRIVNVPGRPQTDIYADSLSSRPKLYKVPEVKIGFLKERCNALLGQSEYIKAARILEEISSLEGTMSFDTRLQMVECYLHLGRGNEANKAEEAVRDIIMTSQSFTADDIYELGSELVENSSHIRGIVLLQIAADMYETNAYTPDDVLDGICSCISKTHDAIRPMIEVGGKSRLLGLDIGLENMIEMKQKFKAVKNVRPENKALKEALSNNWIAFNLTIARQTEKSIKYCQTGIEILETQFSSNAAKYQIYGQLLRNLGVAHYNLGESSEAENYYVKAIQAFVKATDFCDGSDKQKCIELLKDDLKFALA